MVGADPLPLLSSTMETCVEKAVDVTEGGTKYNNTALSFVSPATLVDSLIAIRILVFEEKKLNLKEFHEICENNFKELPAGLVLFWHKNLVLRAKNLRCQQPSPSVMTFFTPLFHFIRFFPI